MTIKTTFGANGDDKVGITAHFAVTVSTTGCQVYPNLQCPYSDYKVGIMTALDFNGMYYCNRTWVRSRNFGCLVTWFCYQLIAKPGNKTAAVPWPDLYIYTSFSLMTIAFLWFGIVNTSTFTKTLLYHWFLLWSYHSHLQMRKIETLNIMITSTHWPLRYVAVILEM